VGVRTDVFTHAYRAESRMSRIYAKPPYIRQFHIMYTLKGATFGHQNDLGRHCVHTKLSQQPLGTHEFRHCLLVVFRCYENLGTQACRILVFYNTCFLHFN